MMQFACQAAAWLLTHCKNKCHTTVADLQARSYLSEAKSLLRDISKQSHPLSGASTSQLSRAVGKGVFDGANDKQIEQNRSAHVGHTGTSPLDMRNERVFRAQQELCVVCMEAQVQVAFRPCMHAVACQACSVLLATKSNECPMCRCVVEQRLLLRPLRDV